MTIQAKQFADDRERVMWNLSHHAPDYEQFEVIVDLREAARNFADVILAECPVSRERSLALTALEDTLQYAIASIARAEVVDQ